MANFALFTYCHAISVLLLFRVISEIGGVVMRSACFDRPPRYLGCPMGITTADSAYDFKYFYNTTSFSCDLVFYIRVIATSRSCMSDSQNVFDSEEACKNACSLTLSGLLLPPLPALPFESQLARTAMTGTQELNDYRDSRCLQPIASKFQFSNCQTSSQSIYAYDCNLEKCIVLIYGGCDEADFNDGSNRFATLDECQQACVRVTDKMDQELPSWIIPAPVTTEPPETETKRTPLMIMVGLATPKAVIVIQQQPKKPRTFFSANPRCNSATYTEVYGPVSCSDNPHGMRYQYNVYLGRCEQFYYTGCRQVIVNLFTSMWQCQKSCEELQNTPPADSACPHDSYIATCPANPCDITGCPSAPTAQCRPNFCGGCNARFYVEEIEVDCTPKAGSVPAPPHISPELAAIISIITEKLPAPYPRSWTCPPGDWLVLCPKNPCPKALYCSRYPEAECRPNYCGGCHAEFYVRNVRVSCTSPFISLK